MIPGPELPFRLREHVTHVATHEAVAGEAFVAAECEAQRIEALLKRRHQRLQHFDQGKTSLSLSLSLSHCLHHPDPLLYYSFNYMSLVEVFSPKLSPFSSLCIFRNGHSCAFSHNAQLQ